mmetsp:Transcript_16104/g.18573  ORF Transcript_16104/g.18573 Transcript_16104/m.18573 type:complete len:107 (-) Transcript_16104:356-676(-)
MYYSIIDVRSTNNELCVQYSRYQKNHGRRNTTVHVTLFYAKTRTVAAVTMLIAAAAILVVERSIEDDDSLSSKLTSSSAGSVGGVTSASSTTVSLFAFAHAVLADI